MISYELAKELEDAGFWEKNSWINTEPTVLKPFTEEERKEWSEEEKKYVCTMTHIVHTREMVVKPGEKRSVKMPLLHELIAACGDRFTGLQRYDYGWHAVSDVAAPSVAGTPENAVARLWLELNKA